MILNQWGCLVTGWKSINIYNNVYVVSESENFRSKMDEYLEDN